MSSAIEESLIKSEKANPGFLKELKERFTLRLENILEKSRNHYLEFDRLIKEQREDRPELELEIQLIEFCLRGVERDRTLVENKIKLIEELLQMNINEL